MENLDAMKERLDREAAEAQARKQETKDFYETLSTAAKGENLPDDFEPVSEAEGRVFTQDQVNDIVRGRLAKEREKYGTAAAALSEKVTEYESSLVEREQRLKASENRYEAKKMLAERGLLTDHDMLNDTILDIVIGGDVEETTSNIFTLQLYMQAPKEFPVENQSIDPVRIAMGLEKMKL